MRSLLCVVFFVIGLKVQAQTKSVLFIGNSYTAVNDLPNLIYNLALANGDTIIYDTNTPGGSYFNFHKTNATTLTKINSRNWDVVVLQEQSQLPTLPLEIAGPDYSPPSANDLCNLIYENDSCTAIVFYMTWGRKTGDATYCADVPAVCTYEGMQLALRDAYLSFAEDNSASVAPAGMAWKTVIDDDPTIELYSGDGSHPNINGSYLTACVFYATLFQESPIGNLYHAGISDELALYLQTTAHHIVFDSLETWHIGEDALLPAFDFSKVFFTCTFESTGEGNILQWVIDDEIYTDENPIHTFPGNGYYDISLTVYDQCDTITITETILIGVDDSGIAENEEEAILFYPNPVEHYLYFVATSSAEEIIKIYNLTGQLMGEYPTHTPADVSNFKPGVYLIQTQQGYYKLVKN